MQTVLGVFDEGAAADRAVSRLTEIGFDRDDIHVETAGAGVIGGATGGHDPSDTSGSGVAVPGPEGGARDGDQQGLLATVGDFFSDLFGGTAGRDPQRAPAGRYAEAIRQGRHVVVVEARDEEDAGRAADLLNELGAVDVDERVEQRRPGAWSGATYNDSPTPPSGQQMMVGGSSVHPDLAPPRQPLVGTPDSLIDTDRSAREAHPDAGGLHEPEIGHPAASSPGGAAAADHRGAHHTAVDRVPQEMQVGRGAANPRGARVVPRTSNEPLREIVRRRAERAGPDGRTGASENAPGRDA